jgi:hypothetical protein
MVGSCVVSLGIASFFTCHQVAICALEKVHSNTKFEFDKYEQALESDSLQLRKAYYLDWEKKKKRKKKTMVCVCVCVSVCVCLCVCFEDKKTTHCIVTFVENL